MPTFRRTVVAAHAAAAFAFVTGCGGMKNYAARDASTSGGAHASSPAAPAVAAHGRASAPAEAAERAASPASTSVVIEGHGSVVVRPFPEPQQSPTGGVLTAAIWDDNQARPGFDEFLARYPQFAEQWGLETRRRVTIRVEDANGVPVGDAPISLRAPNGAIVNLRAHADGTALFWPTSAMLAAQSQQGAIFAVAAEAGGLRTESAQSLASRDATWTLRLNGVPARATAPAIDVAFVVDCTGSMGDEIAYLQAELAGVVKRVKGAQTMRRVRLGLVLYKDRGDDYVTKSFGFTEDLSTYLGWLREARAEGGGDMPESVNAALADTVHRLPWSGDEAARVAFLVADAPPHYYADEQYTYRQALPDLAARGVKLVTVGASGIDKSTEYLFRQMSAYTGGRYVFLTDDSGVGDSHLVPDITGYQVEHLDRILVRVITDEARAFRR
jgi:Mg-chelatase subunit ChlD